MATSHKKFRKPADIAATVPIKGTTPNQPVTLHCHRLRAKTSVREFLEYLDGAHTLPKKEVESLRAVPRLLHLVHQNPIVCICVQDDTMTYFCTLRIGRNKIKLVIVPPDETISRGAAVLLA